MFFYKVLHYKLKGFTQIYDIKNHLKFKPNEVFKVTDSHCTMEINVRFATPDETKSDFLKPS